MPNENIYASEWGYNAGVALSDLYGTSCNPQFLFDPESRITLEQVYKDESLLDAWVKQEEDIYDNSPKNCFLIIPVSTQDIRKSYFVWKKMREAGHIEPFTR